MGQSNKKTFKQIVREQKRMVDRSVRQLEREKNGLKRNEQQIVREIKKLANQNQMKSVNIMARDLVRIRKHCEKFTQFIAQLRAVSLQMTSMQSTHTLSESMKNVSKAMVKLNRKLKLPALQKVMQEFMKQSEKMDMKQEMMQDSIEDAMDEEEDEEESEQIVNQVLDEIGINLGEKLVDAPGKKRNVEKEEVNDDDELEARLNNLRNP